MPIAATVSPAASSSAATSPSVSSVTRQMSSASCSTQPGCGKCCGNSRYERARGRPVARRPRTRARRWCRRRSRSRSVMVVGGSRSTAGSVGAGARGRSTAVRRSGPRARRASAARERDGRSASSRELEQERAAEVADDAQRAVRAPGRAGTTTSRLSGSRNTRRRGRRVKKPVEHSTRCSGVSTAKSRKRAANTCMRAVAGHPARVIADDRAGVGRGAPDQPPQPLSGGGCRRRSRVPDAGSSAGSAPVRSRSPIGRGLGAGLVFHRRSSGGHDTVEHPTIRRARGGG